MAKARFGITLYPLSSRYNAVAQLTPSFTDADLSPELRPVEDSLNLVNSARVTRSTTDGSGGTATYTQPAGMPYSPEDGAPRFQTGANINVQADDDLPARASWIVHVGAVDEDRFSKLSLNLRRRPGLAGAWLATGVSGRVTVDGMYATGGNAPDVIVEGREQTLSRYRWDVSANCSPASPYTVARLDTTSKIDSGSSTLYEAAPAGATELHVRFTRTAWTTIAAEYPLTVMVGAYGPITVTAAAVPITYQTLTCEPLAVAIPAGLKVRLAPPYAAVLALGGES